MSTGRQSKRPAKAKRGHPRRYRRSTAPGGTRPARMHASMTIAEILASHPKASDVLDAYGLSCHHCMLGENETLEEGALLHGLLPEDLENLLHDLGALLPVPQPSSARITVTRKAALALRNIAKRERKTRQVLRVTTDGEGKYYLEFRAKKNKGDQLFRHPDVPDIRIAAAPTTLHRTGCVTIDFRGGAFKLEPSRKGACGESACACGGRGGTPHRRP